MTQCSRRDFEPIAIELDALITCYEQAATQLVSTWPDHDLYGSVSRQVDRMKMLFAAVPELTVPWIALLIAHSELMQCLLRPASAATGSAQLDDCRARHAAAMRHLREQCAWRYGARRS